MTEFDIELDTSGVRSELKRIEQQWNGDPVYVVGSNVEYGIYLEFATRDMPAYPWFKPAIREFKANPEAFIRKNTELGSIDEINSTEELVKTVAFGLQNQMQDNVSAGTAADRSPGTDPEHPKIETGTLVNSIQAVRVN